MSGRINRDNVAIVLVRPRYPENIGAAARAMRNTGFKRLIVVAPARFDREPIMRLATHEAADLVDQIRRCDTLSEALAEFSHVVGTTARRGKQRSAIGSPAMLASRLIPISQQNQVALVFGPEDRGLTNADLRLCHSLLTIPTAEFSSINLAQSVMIVCYNLFIAGQPQPQPHTPRLAARHELDGMYDTLKDILVRIDYISKDNADFWMNKIRRFGTRMQLRASEVSVIRGICRQINWYATKCYRDGRAKAASPPGNAKAE